MSEQEKEFFSALDEESRLRVSFTRVKKEVTDFVVQVLIGKGSTSKELIRYDTAHARPHKHVFVPGEEPRRVDINARYDPVRGWADTLTIAEIDAKSFWEKQSRTASGDIEIEEETGNGS